MKSKSNRLQRHRLAASAIATLYCGNAAFATTYTWTKNSAATQDWTVTANWDATNGVFATGSGNTLTFFANTTTALVNVTNAITTSVPSALTMNVLTLNGMGTGSGTASNITIGTSASTWTFDGTTPSVNLNGVNGTKPLNYTVAANLTLAQANTTFAGDGTAGFNFSGAIEGASKGITKSGTSTLTLSGANTFTGGTTINTGTLKITSDGNLGGTSGGVKLDGGTLSMTAMTLGATRTVTVGAGNGTIINPSGGSAIFQGTVSGAGNALTINNSSGGTFDLTGNVSLGTLTFAGTSNLWLSNNANITNAVSVGANQVLNLTSATDATVASYNNVSFNLNGGILRNRIGQNTLTTPITLAASSIIGNRATADALTFSGAVSSTAASGKQTLTFGDSVAGANSGTITQDAASVISNGGTGGTVALTVNMGGTSGNVLLKGTNTYTGNTTISGGTLKVDGGSLANSNVTVSSGGKLASGSTGTVGKTVTVNNGATLAAGGSGSVGTATVAGDLNFSSGSIFDWDLTTGLGDGTYDTVSVTGALNITSGAKFNVVSNTAYSDTFWDATHTWSNFFGANAIDNFLATNFLYSGSTTAPTAEGSFTVSGSNLTWTAVPEISTALIGGLIGAGLLLRRRRN